MLLHSLRRWAWQRPYMVKCATAMTSSITTCISPHVSSASLLLASIVASSAASSVAVVSTWELVTLVGILVRVA